MKRRAFFKLLTAFAVVPFVLREKPPLKLVPYWTQTAQRAAVTDEGYIEALMKQVYDIKRARHDEGMLIEFYGDRESVRKLQEQLAVETA